MQYILTEEELKQGCEIIESWSTKIPISQLYDRQKELHKEGYFTCVTYTTNELVELKVYKKYY